MFRVLYHAIIFTERVVQTINEVIDILQGLLTEKCHGGYGTNVF